MMWSKRCLQVVVLWLVAGCGAAQEADPQLDPRPDPGMDLDRLHELVTRIDPEAERSEAGNQWQFQVLDRTLLVVADPAADRMRIMTPIVEAKMVEPALMERMMQANFDSALDARYAIAQGIVWGTFIHPLADLSDPLFLSAVGQVVNVADTFGTTFSSGVLLYGGGDSGEQQRQLLERLLKLKDRDQT